MSEPIRVLHIFAPNYKYRFGGPIFDWKYAFSKWDDSGIHHLVFDTESRSILDAKEAFDFQISTNQFITSKWERFRWIITLQRLLIKNKNEFDIIHYHVLWWAGLLMAVRANHLEIPTLYQSVLLNEDTPSGIVKQKFGKFKLKYLKKFKLIVPISDFLAEDYLKFGFQPTQVQTLMNSVDTEIFHPVGSETEKAAMRRKYSLPEGARILLFVGSIIQRKGVDVLINAFIEAERKNKELHLVLVGPRTKQENPSLDEDFIRYLRTILEKNDVSSKVTFMGLVEERAQLAEIYRASDLFVFPSRNEGLPNVVLEAMACALPVVVSNLPVLRNVIRDGENGFFVPLEDAGSLIKAIVSIAQNPILAGKIGQAARQYVVASHGFEEWQWQLQQVYRRLLP